MTTPTGTISMSDVNVELGKSSTATISLNDTDVRILAGIPSGTISMNDLRGKTYKAKYLGIASYNATATIPIKVYAWSESSGFGSMFANPSSLPDNLTGRGWSISANPTSTALALGTTTGTSTTGGLNAWAWSSSGFGTKYANATVSFSSVNYGTEYNNSGNVLAAGRSLTPYFRAFAWTNASGIGTEFSSPATLPQGQTYGTTFKADDSVVGFVNAPGTSGARVNFYAWSNSSGFGTKYANPAVLPVGGTDKPSFLTDNSGNSVVLVTGMTTSPRIYVYNWSGGFGTKYADPATLPYTASQGSEWGVKGPGDYYISVGCSGTPYIITYKFIIGSGYSTRYAAPASIATSIGTDAKYSAGAKTVATGNSNSPYISAWPAPYDSGGVSYGYGTKYSNPATLPVDTVSRITFF